jgi:hypothetical protein
MQGINMEFCERCFEEYPDGEITTICEFGEKIFCVPCAHHFEIAYQQFLIKFINGKDSYTLD